MKYSRKRDEKNIMQTFANSSLTMDEKFKAKLKKQVVAHDKQLKGNKRSFAWPKFILAPALLFALVAVGSLLLFNNGGDPKSPLKPTQVSAAEVIERSKQYYQALDVSKYNFIIAKTKTTRGPMNNCSETRGLGNVSGTYEVYTYWSNDGSLTEAQYTRQENSDEGVKEDAFYSNNSTELRQYYPSELQYALPPVAAGSTSGGRNVYIFVDKNGVELKNGELKAVRQNGREVYIFYMRYNEDVLSSWCKNEIIEAVFDANTYENLEFNTYQQAITPDQLIFSSQRELTFQSVNEAEALRVMTEAGFDKENASSQKAYKPNFTAQ